MHYDDILLLFCLPFNTGTSIFQWHHLPVYRRLLMTIMSKKCSYMNGFWPICCPMSTLVTVHEMLLSATIQWMLEKVRLSIFFPVASLTVQLLELAALQAAGSCCSIVQAATFHISQLHLGTQCLKCPLDKSFFFFAKHNTSLTTSQIHIHQHNFVQRDRRWSKFGRKGYTW